jgi:molecular chaperone IbpA
MNELDIIRNHFLGFHDDFFNNFRTVSTYPPYNIKEKDDKGVIEFAVAGYDEKDLTIEIKENSLSITGSKKDNGSDYLHKGISTKKFNRRFELHKQVVIDNAELKNGMLQVNYHREIPELEKPRKITIKKS